MLLQKVVTKKDKRKAIRKHRGLIFVFVGLVMIVVSLFYTAYLEKPPKVVSPLAKNQITDTGKVEQILKGKEIPYQNLEVEDDLSYKIVLSSGSEVYLDSKKDLTTQLSSLQLILSQLKIEGKTFKRLDFRFEKPVIAM